VDAGATLKLSGQKGEVRSPLQIANNGSIEADGMTSGTVYSSVTNNGTIGVKNGSLLALYSVSNAGGTISWDGTSKVELKSGTITGGILQGPVSLEGLRTDAAADLNGAFVGRGGALKGVASAATIIVPEDGSLGIMDSLSNEGQLVIEGGAVDGRVTLTSPVTTLGGAGEVVFTGDGGGLIQGPYTSGAKLINENTIRGQGKITPGGYALPLEITNRGLIRADQGSPLSLKSGVLTNEGDIEASGAGGLMTSHLINKGNVKVDSLSQLDVPSVSQESGSFLVEGGLVFGSSLVQTLNILGGTFSGLTSVQNLTLTGGALQIGNRELEVTATYSQGPNGVLEVSLGGYDPGVSYDLIRTNTSSVGNTYLGGTVRVSFTGNFEPKPGDEFTFFEHGPRSGQFANVVNATPYALGFELVYGSSTVTLRVSALPTFYVAKDGSCGGNKPCYKIIQDAINAAGSAPSVIKIGEGTYTEPISLNDVKTLILKGGFNASFGSQTPAKTFIKAPKAPKGSITMQMLTIRP